MATLTGKVYYNESSYAGDLSQRTSIKTEDALGNDVDSGQYVEASNPLKGITVMVWNTATMQGVGVATKEDGTYTVTNLPAGSYKIVESFGSESSGTDGTVDFNVSKKTMGEPFGLDPIVAYIESLNLNTNGANNIVSLSPNVIYKTVAASDTINNINFCDAPNKTVPINLHNYATVGDDLIISVDGGTFGTVAEGTVAGTSGTSSPYNAYTGGAYTADVLDIQSAFTFIQYGTVEPDGGRYTIVNIANLHTFDVKWFDTPGRVLGDEQGRFLLVNGDSPGKYFFREEVTVDPNKSYLFSAWIMNIFRLYKSGLPLFKVEVADSQSIFFSENVTVDNPLNVTVIPTWKQIGAVIPSSMIKENTLTVTFYSMGYELSGNDYCVDEISLKEITPCDDEPQIKKEVDKLIADEDEVIKYTITLTNNTGSYITDLLLYDRLQYGTELVNGDGTGQPVILNLKVDEYEITAEITKESLESGIDVSKLIVEGLISSTNARSTTENPYFFDLIEGRLPYGVSVTAEYYIKVPDVSELPSDRLARDIALYKYITPFDDPATAAPRTVISNEVQTKIREPNVIATKSGPPYVLCGDEYEYNITFENTGDDVAETDKIVDYAPKNLVITKYTLKNNDVEKKLGTDYEVNTDYDTSSPPKQIITFLEMNSSGALDIQPNTKLIITLTGNYQCDDGN